MKNKKTSTAFPFLFLLLGIIFLVKWSDRLADQISATPRVIKIGASEQYAKVDLIWQFESENSSESDNAEFKADSLYVAATRAYKNEQLMDAENSFVILINRYPCKAELLNYLGLIALRNKDLLESDSYFLQALTCKADYVPALINLGLLSSKRGQISRATGYYETAIALQSLNPKPYLNKGIMHCRVEEWRAAIDALNGAVELASGKQKAKALAYRGMAFGNVGEIEEALSDLNEATNLAPSYLFPRIQNAVFAQDNSEKLASIDKVLLLNEDYAPGHFYRGAILETMGEIEAAEKAYEQALQLNPNDEDISEIMSDFYIKNEFFEKANQFMSQVYKNDTISPKSDFFRAKMLSRQNQIEKALVQYDKAIEKAEGAYPEAFLNKGILLKKQGSIDGAIEAYQQAIKERKEYEEAWYNLALAYAAKNELDDAKKCYEKSISINPKNTKAMYNLALLFGELGDNDLVGKWLKACLDVDSGYVKAAYNLGLNYYRKEDFQNAKRTFEDLLQQQADYTKAWYNLALCERELGNEDLAVLAYEQAINLDPTYVAAWKNLGNMEARRGNIDKAINQYQQAIDLDRSDASLRFNLALQYEKKEEYQLAIMHLNKAVQLNPEYVKAIKKWKALAEVSENQDEFLIAESFMVSLEGNSDDYYDLARKLHKNKQLSLAIDWYDRAVDKGKTGPWPYYWKGKAHEGLGDLNEAKKEYLSALSETPLHKFSLYRMYLMLSETDQNAAQDYLNKLKTNYPDFVKEKNL